eukprot:TRINITY_DN802_c2_g1_i1.p1 TRINITY_DN802_c2_g1~~TRINITY_DN802_c2_g1_i1.p1  ORF type:complete len:1015 (+),score=364.65 TRINITY_DN802_c2_g1_i1:90-3134(+)
MMSNIDQNNNQENQDFKVEEIIRYAKETAMLSSNLPPRSDLEYFYSFSQIRQNVDQLRVNLLTTVQELIQYSDPDASRNIDLTKNDDEENLEAYSEINDITTEMIERVFNTIKDSKRKKQLINDDNIINQAEVTHGKKTFNMVQSTNIIRPQLKFEDKIDNSRTDFIPKIKTKPNATISLEKVFREENKDSNTMMTEEKGNNNNSNSISKDIKNHMMSLGVQNQSNGTKKGQGGYPNPYCYEIENYTYLDHQLVKRKEVLYLPIETTKCTEINKPYQLQELVTKLAYEREIAVDLEQHGYRSFQGFVCLMQISTRNEDFLIDTLELRSELQIMNEIFTDPKIVKVFHGSDSDIVWLQRDFGIYIVNLFDTGQASRVLEYPKFSLAYLLEHFCNVKTNKAYQLADWRIRELPDVMKHYARIDTHYLLYIYDRLHNELISKGNSNNNLLLATLNRSRELSKKTYTKKPFDKNSYFVLYNRNPNYHFNSAQLRVLEAVYAWRDGVAREEDESERYVLPNHMLFKIAEYMPETTAELFKCCDTIPPLVQVRGPDIVLEIVNAKSDNNTHQHNSNNHGSSSYSFYQQQRKTGLLAEADEFHPSAKVFAQTQKKKQSPSLGFHNNNKGQTPGINRLLKDKNSDNLVPDLSKEELYAEAGWLENLPAWAKASSGNSTSAVCDPLNVNFSTDTPLQNNSNSIFSDHGKKNNNSSNNQTIDFVMSKFNKNLLSKFNSSGLSGSSLMDENSNLEEEEEEEEGYDQEQEQNEEDPSVERVPTSLEDIYRLSRRNRKRNKEKKKLREGIKNTKLEDIPEDDSDDEDEEEDSNQNPEDFMKKIGWLDENENISVPKYDNKNKSSNSKNSSHSNSSSNNIDNNSHHHSNENRHKRPKSSYNKSRDRRKKKYKHQNKTYPPNNMRFDYNKNRPYGGMQMPNNFEQNNVYNNNNNNNSYNNNGNNTTYKYNNNNNNSNYSNYKNFDNSTFNITQSKELKNQQKRNHRRHPTSRSNRNTNNNHYNKPNSRS